MATRGEELNTRLTATDDASTVVDQVADKVGDLEDQPHDIELDANADQVNKEIETLDRRLAGLTDEQREIVLKAAAGQAQSAIDRLTKDLANAQKLSDEEIKLRVDARGNAEAKLAAIQSELRELDGKKVTPSVEVRGIDALAAKLDSIGGDLGSLGPQLAAALRSPAGITAAAAAGITALSDSVAETTLSYAELARLSGTTIEDASRIGRVWQTNAGDIKDFSDVLLNMAGVLEGNSELTQQLGIDLDDGRGLTERFVQVVQILGEKFDDATQRGIVGAQLFGEEGIRQVNSLTTRVADLDDAMAAIPTANLFTQEDVDRALEMQAAAANMKTELQAAGAEISENTIPLISFLAEALAASLGPINDLLAKLNLDELNAKPVEATEAVKSFLETLNSGTARTPAEIANSFADAARQVGLTQSAVDKLGTMLSTNSDEGTRFEAMRLAFEQIAATDPAAAQTILAVLKQVLDNVDAGNEKAMEWAEGWGLNRDNLAELVNLLDQLPSSTAAANDELGNTGTAAGIIADEIARAKTETAAASERLKRFGPDGVENMGALAEATDEAAGSVDRLSSGIEGLLGLMGRPLDEQVALLDIAEKLQSTAEARAEAGVKGSAAEVRALQGLSREFERFVRDTPGLDQTKALRVFTAINDGDLGAIRSALEELTADRRIRIGFEIEEPTVFDTSRGPITIGAPGSVTAGNGGAGSGARPEDLAVAIQGVLGALSGGAFGNTYNTYLAQPTIEQVAETQRLLLLRNGPQ